MDELNDKDLIGITALLIHAAKIDENYTDKEKKLILQFIESQIKDKSNVKEVLDKALEQEKMGSPDAAWHLLYYERNGY